MQSIMHIIDGIIKIMNIITIYYNIVNIYKYINFTLLFILMDWFNYTIITLKLLFNLLLLLTQVRS